MANGDKAAARGLATVAPTDDRRMGYDEINKTRDMLVDAQDTVDTGIAKIAAGSHVPSTIAAGAYKTFSVSFPAGRFSNVPRVVLTPVSEIPDKRATSLVSVTTSGFTYRQHNGTGSTSSATVHWIAVQP